MALKVHSPAPDFTLPSTERESFTLSTEASQAPIILYFYPKDFTRVCTKEACGFRDEFSSFQDLNTKVIGISRDTIETHKSFKKQHNLPFELLSDPKGEVCKLYDALVPFIKLPKRVTYLLSTDMKIAAVYEEMFGAEGHIREMLKKLNAGINE